MSNSAPSTISRRRFLGFGAVSLMALPVTVGIVGYPKQSNGCAGPVVGGGTPTTVPPQHHRRPVRTASAKGRLAERGEDHREF
jgi:hypothetical protein